MAGEWINGNDFNWLKPTQADGTFMRGMQLGMQMRHQRITESIAMQEAESKVKLMDLNFQMKRAELRAYENLAEGNAQLATALSETAGKWTEPESKARFWGIASKYPTVMKSPQFKELVDNFQLADTAKARHDYLQSQIGGRENLENIRIGGREDLEETKFQNRAALQDEKYGYLAELQEDSQEARALRDEIIHGYNLERDAKKPNQSAGKKYDMPYSVELKYRAMLNAINKDYNLKPAERQKKIEEVYREMKSQFTLPSPATTPKATQPAPSQGPSKITSQAEFDALPSGAMFINPADGKVLRKK